MAEQDCMSQSGGWKGYPVGKWRHEVRGEQRWLVIEPESVRAAVLHGLRRRGECHSRPHDATHPRPAGV
ncbi:hypothetical protein ACFQGW_17560 [Xanthomonas theicola]